MVAEQHKLIGRHIIEAVVELISGSHALGIEREHLVGDEFTVKAESDQIHAHGGDHDPDRADRFAASQRDHPQGGGAGQSQRGPAQLAEKTFHIFSKNKRTPAVLDRCQLHQPTDAQYWRALGIWQAQSAPPKRLCRRAPGRPAPPRPVPGACGAPGGPMSPIPLYTWKILSSLKRFPQSFRLECAYLQESNQRKAIKLLSINTEFIPIQRI